MEVQEMPIVPVPESETIPSLENRQMDRIAFELWQRGSLPVPALEGEVEEVASHSSCL